MKNLRKPLSAILCALILLSAFSICAGAYSTDNPLTSASVRKVSGKTGDCSYEYYVSIGKLYITGSGAMADYDDQNKAPWIKEYNTHTLVSIAEGVTYIGTCAFKGSTSLNELTVPNTIQTIGERAFYNCPNLKSVTIPESVTQIGDMALGFTDKNGSAVKISGFTISANFESAARQYAKKYGFNFVSLNGIPETETVTETVTVTEPATETVTQPPTEPEVELEDSEYSLWVGSTAVNSSNASSITGDGLSGNISFDPANSTLTLDNAKVESFPKNHITSDNKPYYAGIYSGKNLTIRLVGESTVKESGSFSPSSDYYTIFGVASATGFLTFTGDGKLTTDGIDAPYVKIDKNASVSSTSKFTSSVLTGGLLASTVTKRNSRAVNASTLIVDGTLQASQGGLYGEVPAVSANNITVSENATLSVGLTTTYLNVSTIRDFYAKPAKAIELSGKADINGLLITVANSTAPTYDFDVNEPVNTGYGIYGANAEVIIGQSGTLVAQGTKRAIYASEIILNGEEYVITAGESSDSAKNVELNQINDQRYVTIEAVYIPVATESVTETETFEPTETASVTATETQTNSTEPTAISAQPAETSATPSATEPVESATTPSATSKATETLSVPSESATATETSTELSTKIPSATSKTTETQPASTEPTETASPTQTDATSPTETDTNPASQPNPTEAETATATDDVPYLPMSGVYRFIPAYTDPSYTYKLVIEDTNGEFHTFDLTPALPSPSGTVVYVADIPMSFSPAVLSFQTFKDGEFVNQLTMTAEDYLSSGGVAIETKPKPAEPTTQKPAVKAKKANPLTVKTKNKTIKAKKLKSKKLKYKAVTAKNAKGKLTCSIVKKGTAKKLYKKLKITNKGTLTLKKGKYAKKSYKIKLKITAKGNASYLSKTVTKTIKIKVK